MYSMSTFYIFNYLLDCSDCMIIELSIFVCFNVISNLCLNAVYVIMYANKYDDDYYYTCIMKGWYLLEFTVSFSIVYKEKILRMINFSYKFEVYSAF